MAATFSNVSPWALRPLDPIVVTELQQRIQSYGSNPNLNNGTPLYSGPRTAWMRVCSNGSVDGIDGFVLGGVNGFNDTYGFGTNSTGTSNQTVLGYTAAGDPHVLANTNASVFPHRPSPGIIGIETEFFGAGSSFPGLCRKATIKWRCNSVDQLNYMFPYFLSPGVSVIVEWGWNNYNPASLIDLTNLGTPATDSSPGSGILGLFTNSNLIYNNIGMSNGNYDCHVGRIFDYSYSMNDAGAYECSTVVVNAAFLIEGQSLRITTVTNDNLKTPVKDFKTTIDNGLEDFAKKGTFCKLAGNNETWIPMSRFSDLINNYLALNQPGKGSGASIHKTLKFDISTVVISGHPLLKSIDKNVLIPNKYSPTLAPIADVSTGATTAGQTYTNTQFSVWQTDFSNLGLEFQYDDLTQFIPISSTTGSIAASFPQYTNITDSDGRQHQSGYWGYLSDIYISTSLIKEAVDSNDTTLKLLEYILGIISTAGSNIWHFKVITDPAGNTTYSVIDENYNTWSSTSTNSSIPIFNLGSVGPTGSGGFTNMGMECKMSQEMANQAILGQSKYIYHSQNPNASTAVTSSNKVISSNNDEVSLFSSDDRLYGYAFAGSAQTETPLDKQKRVVSRGNNTDIVRFKDKKGSTHTATEWDTNLMTTLIKLGSQASYLASPLMNGTEITVECLGIGGIRYLDMIAFDSVATPYTYKRAVWQIEGVKNTIEDNVWKTSVTAKVRPITILSNQNTSAIPIAS